MLHALFLRSFARRFLTIFAALTTATAALFAQISALDGFDPNVDGNVYAVVLQPDGKTIIAGEFANVQPKGLLSPIPRSNIARLNVDGSLDLSFDAVVNGPIRAVVVQPDGRVLIGGDFSTVGGFTRNHVARLNANGVVDPDFDPNVTGTIDPDVFALALQADGAVIVGGDFSQVQPPGQSAPVARQNLARFTATGALDAAWNPSPNTVVFALHVQTDGKLLVGGGFTTIQASGSTTKTPRNRIARLNTDGTLDTAFDPDANDTVQAFAVQRDGKILVGGTFTTMKAAEHVRIVRLNAADGAIDPTFTGGVSGTVRAIGVQRDGGILVAGAFTAIWSTSGGIVGRGALARFTPDGLGDFDFAPGFNGEVVALALQADGKIIVGGYFTRATPTGAFTPQIRNHVARVDSRGKLDATFALDPGGRPLASVVQSDGKIVIAGSFANVGGGFHTSVARLNTNGSVDTAFQSPVINGAVYAVGLLPDGKLLIGGGFTTVGGALHNRIARLNTDGTVDSTFTAAVDGPVSVIVVQSDGAALVGGSFFNTQGSGETTTTARANIFRLTAAGGIDATFNPSVDQAVAAIAVQSDNKIVFGGSFSVIRANGGLQMVRNRIARVNADGTLDATFDPNFNEHISAIALQSDGKILVGGRFTALAPPNVTAVVVRNRIARLNADGTVDEGFDPNANASVLTIAVQTGDNILVGGAFTSFHPAGDAEPTERNYIARLTPAGKVDTAFDLRLDRRSGNRVDSLTLVPGGSQVLVGGSFVSLQPDTTQARAAGAGFVRIEGTGALDSSFELGTASAPTTKEINALAIQPEGKVIAAGEFSDLGGLDNNDIARFNAEGTVDVTFSSEIDANAPINAVAVRTNSTVLTTQLESFAWLNPDGTFRSAFAPGASTLTGGVNAVAVDNQGRVVLGGSFTNVTSTANFSYLSRYNADGSLDTAFLIPINDYVTDILIEPDGKIIIAGRFTSVGGQNRRGLARLNADGSLDTGFDPTPNSFVFALLRQSDGKIIVGGEFTSFTPNGGTAIARRSLARLDPSGSVDLTFDPSPNGAVYAIAEHPENKIMIGGDFTALQPGATGTATNRLGIARLNGDGTVDTTFTANTNDSVVAIAVQPDGKIVFGGEFSGITPADGTQVARNYLARVNSTGAVDTDFNPNPNSQVASIVREASGSFVVVGNFGAFQPGGTGTAILRDRLARITSTGGIDPVLNPDFVGDVIAVALAPDGSLLLTGNFSGIRPNGLLIVGGAFTSIAGVPAAHLALLSDDGSVNGVFQAAPNAPVHAVLALPDGGFVIGGEFTTISGATHAGLARYASDNALDATFNPSFDGPVYAVARQSDGKLLVAGSFTTANGVARSSIARLNADGSLDASFIPLGLTGGVPVRGLGLQPDGRIVFFLGSEPAPGAGGFSSFEVRRLNADGSDDASFTRSLVMEVGAIRAISVLADGRIVVGGSFPSIGNIVTGPGGGGSGPAYLARLNANGTIDSSFIAAPNAAVTALAPQPDGRLMIAGKFTRVGGVQRVGLARIDQTEVVTDKLGVTQDRSTVIWSRSGPSVELSSVTFESSTDSRTWTALGSGTRMNGTANWQLTGQSFPATGAFYLRARGVTISSAGKSSGLHEVLGQFNYDHPFGTSAGGAVVAGDAVTVDPNSGIVQSVPPTAAGVYFPSSGGTSPTILGVSSTAKVLGAGEQVGANIVHPNGNTYDQILLEGAATTITADPGEIVRVSFADLTHDLVQVEFSGAGSLSVVLDAARGPAPAAYYNQPSVSYMQGHAAIIIVGANETTNVSVFSVGPLTAVDQSLFRNDVTYDGVADLAYLAISSTDGKFGSIRTGNVNYFATRGLTGIYAPGVHVSDVVNIGDINGYDSAVAMLMLGSAREINVAGGDFWQQNGQRLEQSGVSQLNFVGGMTSHGRLLPAQSNRAPLDEGSATTVTPED